MYSLIRISMQNWYLIDAIDIDIRGATALVGPTGAGKSSIQDAIQTVITGASKSRMNLNPSASGRSERTVLEYCLGMAEDPAEGGKPLRESCESVIALTFREEPAGNPITIGIAMSANIEDSREVILSRFIIPNCIYSVEMAKRKKKGGLWLVPWQELVSELRKTYSGMEEYRVSAEKFTEEVLKSMSGGRQPSNVKYFLRSFMNALAFKPVFDPSTFVRQFILEPDHLDVNRVRESIGTWQELEQTIEETETKLVSMESLTGRFRNWARKTIQVESYRYRAAAAESRRSVLEMVSRRDQYREKLRELEWERERQEALRETVRNREEVLESKRIIAHTSDEASRIRQIESEEKLAERDLKDAENRFEQIKNALTSLANLAVLKSKLPDRFREVIKAATNSVKLIEKAYSFHDALSGKGKQLEKLVRDASKLKGLDELLDRNAEEVNEELRSTRERVELLEDTIADANSSSLLSPSSRKLLDELTRMGMEPLTLRDVVEIVDEDWQFALESLLGQGREAILVEPEFLDEAFEIMARNRDDYASCTLVNTSKSGEIDDFLPDGSILETIRTDNHHAFAFMKVRIGSYLKAANETELLQYGRGIMQNGKTNSGLGLSVQPSSNVLVFGMSAIRQSTMTAKAELDPLRNKHTELRATVRMLRDASRTVSTCESILAGGVGLAKLEHALIESGKRLEELKNERKTAVKSGTKKLLKELDQIKQDRDESSRELTEKVEPMVETLQGEVARSLSKFEESKSALFKTLKIKRSAWNALKSQNMTKIQEVDSGIGEPLPEEIAAATRTELKSASSQDPRRALSKLWKEHIRKSEKLVNEVEIQQSAVIRELVEYSAEFRTKVPQIDEDGILTGYLWALTERNRLERNELRKYRKACAKAATEMKRILQEDLLARLAEKLNKVHLRIELLNSVLTHHKFTGQTYSFEATVNQRFSLIHDLAMKIAGSSGNHTDEPAAGFDDTAVDEAVEQLEGMIEGSEDATILADYREYYSFEMIMISETGKKTTLSARAVKGSGGETQVPYYVASAASLVTAYFGHNPVNEQNGMGLALFDEAFNKLDVPNTQALMNYFKELGLQLMIAGPEDKRATFTEVLDTIILVNRSTDGESVYIDAEYPGEKAREALGAINPDHGIVADAAE